MMTKDEYSLKSISAKQKMNSRPNPSFFLINMKDNIRLLYIDLFCGAGGTSTGVEMANLNNSKCAKVIACVNHDKNAIASHLANHPDAMHFTEDIRTLDLTGLKEHVKNQHTLYPDAKIVLWASLECTNFSRAKGGLPRDADSRTLAEHLFRYIDEINPDYIQIENVEEFMSWGDIDEKGKPISKDAGRLYMLWVQKVCKRGYVFDYRILNSANYGAYTSRKRFFGIFAKHDLPIVFPEATHERNPNGGMFGSLKPWMPVKDILDLEKQGNSIFDRKKPLVDATLQRIYAGLIKFVAGGKQAFLSKQYGGDPSGKNISIEQPAGTITCKDHHALVTIKSESKICFIDMMYGKGTPASVDEPAMTVTANPKHNLITVVQEPSVENRYLMNPQFGCEGASIEKPCFTLIAKMDKRPPYLIDTTSTSRPSFIREEHGTLIYEIYDTDSEIMKKIKEFMARYGKTDIMMRMLDEIELKMIMGFPRDYVLIGTQADRKKYIGNAVVTVIPQMWAEALAEQLKNAS